MVRDMKRAIFRLQFIKVSRTLQEKCTSCVSPICFAALLAKSLRGCFKSIVITLLLGLSLLPSLKKGKVPVL